MLERDVEMKVMRWAKEHGWLAFKFTSPSQRSVPDRIFMRNGVVAFAEIKAPTRKPTPKQEAEMQRIRAAGVPVEWFDDAEKAIAWLDSL